MTYFNPKIYNYSNIDSYDEQYEVTEKDTKDFLHGYKKMEEPEDAEA